VAIIRVWRTPEPGLLQRRLLPAGWGGPGAHRCRESSLQQAEIPPERRSFGLSLSPQNFESRSCRVQGEGTGSTRGLGATAATLYVLLLKENLTFARTCSPSTSNTG
jgi:hypothetical protein